MRRRKSISQARSKCVHCAVVSRCSCRIYQPHGYVTSKSLSTRGLILSCILAPQQRRCKLIVYLMLVDIFSYVLTYHNTCRADGAHAKLKMMLKNNKGDLVASWDAMNNLTILQHDKIKASFQQSFLIVEHSF